MSKQTQLQKSIANARVTIVAVDNNQLLSAVSEEDGQLGYAPRAVCFLATADEAARALESFFSVHLGFRPSSSEMLRTGLNNTIRSIIEKEKRGPQPMFGWTSKANGRVSFWLSLAY